MTWLPFSRRAGPAVAGLIAIVVMAPHVFPLTSLSQLSYDPLDANLFLWNFWWTGEALGSARSPYWTPLLAHPFGASLAFHSFPLPHSLIAWAARWLADGLTALVVTYNLLVLASSVASALGIYWLAYRLTMQRVPALVASLIFTGATFRLLNVARLHVVATEFLVGYVVCFVAFVERPTRARAAGCGVCLALSLYTSPEYALYSLGFSGVWLFWQWWSAADWPRPEFWRGLVIAALLFVALAAPLLAVQAADIRSGRVRAERPLAEARAWSPALLSFVTPSRMHPLYGQVFAATGDYGTEHVTGMRSETAIPPTVWLLALIGCLWATRDGSRFWVAAAGVFLVLTLGPVLRISGTWITEIPMPYTLLYILVPPLRASRDPTRFFALAMIMVSVVSAYGVRGCLRPLRSRGVRTLAGAAIGLLVYVDTLTIWPPKVHADDLVPHAYDRIVGATGSFAVLDLTSEQQALIAQTRHRRPITGGSVANPRARPASAEPAVARDFRNAATVLQLDETALALRLADGRAELDRLRIRFVVFPEGAPALIGLAKRMGLRVVVDNGIVVAERDGG